MSLPPAVSGERFEYEGVSCYTAGQGPPLLLLHSVNAAGAAADVKPLYEHWRATRTVFAPDLPGFGFSDRSDREYTPRLMTDAVHATLAQIRQRCGPGPVDALALSLSCEYLARAAVEAPGHYRSLALVSPTGFSGSKRRYGAPGSSLFVPWLYRALRGGPGSRRGERLFKLLTRPGVIRYFLRRTWGSREIDEELWRYDVATTRQPGAWHVPLYFLSAGLFSRDINTLYEALTMPVWMSHGMRGDFVDYRGRSTVERRGNWRFTVFPTGALPYFEVPERFNTAWGEFLAAAG